VVAVNGTLANRQALQAIDGSAHPQLTVGRTSPQPRGQALQAWCPIFKSTRCAPVKRPWHGPI
jgi:hypothetical protein